MFSMTSTIDLNHQNKLEFRVLYLNFHWISTKDVNKCITTYHWPYYQYESERLQNYSVLPLIAKCWLKRILEKWNWKNGIFNFCLYKNQIFGKSDFGKIWLSNTVESQSWVVLGPVNIWLLPQLLIGTQEIHIFGNSEFRKIRFLENQIFGKSDFWKIWFSNTVESQSWLVLGPVNSYW